ncbi:helix-turn-helix transcriptional regulator [Kitasatospora sp. NPDC004531]
MAQAAPAQTVNRQRREELRRFLRSRRARLQPADVGLADAGWRRTPGLRREEVAVLAGIGVSWYTWLEQGRDIQVSADVLEGVSSALRLDEAERAHFYRLAGLNTPAPRSIADRTLTARLQRIVDRWLPAPAMLVDRHGHTSAFNAAAQDVFDLGPDGCDLVTRFFLDEQWRTRFPELQAQARETLGFFLGQAARYPHDPAFARTTGQLLAASPLFRQLWEHYDLALAPQAQTLVRHPTAGVLTFEHTVFDVAEASESRLHLYLPVPASPRCQPATPCPPALAATVP